MGNKDDTLHIKMNGDEKIELTALVAKLSDPDATVSQFVRDAIREKMAAARKKLERAEAQAMA